MNKIFHFLPIIFLACNFLGDVPGNPSNNETETGHRKPENRKLLIESAVTRGDLVEIEKLLNHRKWNINDHFGSTDHTLLHAAVDHALKTGNYDFLNFVLRQPGLDINAGDQQKSTALHRAASGNDEEVVRILLNASASSEIINYQGYTALDEKVSRLKKCQSDEILNLLCVHRAYINKHKGHYSCGFGWLSQSCKPNAVIIEELAKDGNWHPIEGLLKDGKFEINKKFSHTQHTLLHAAVDHALKTGNYDFLNFVLQQPGLDINAGDQQESTALHRAASGNDEEVVKRLLHANANPNLKNHFGYTALDEGIEHRKKGAKDSILTLLCQYNAQFSKYKDKYLCHPSLSDECIQLFKEADVEFQSKWKPLTDKIASKNAVYYAWKKLMTKYYNVALKQQKLNICKDNAYNIIDIKKESSDTKNPWEEKLEKDL